MLVLAGGPGGSNTELASQLAGEDPFAQSELIAIDQRGTAADSPLRCERAETVEDMGQFLGGNLPLAGLQACLTSGAFDARHYGTMDAAADLDDLLVDLHEDGVDLFGVSYGTVLAREYLRRHGERVHAAILDSVDSPTVSSTLEFAHSTQRALEQLWAECAGQKSCGRAFPDPASDLLRAMAWLRTAPPRLTVRSHFGGKDPVALRFDANALAMTVRALLYNVETRGFVPLLAHRAAMGDVEPAARFGLDVVGGILKGLSLGMFLSVTCSEDLAGVTRERAGAETAGTMLGMSRVGPVLDACAFWPSGEVPAAFHTPLHTDVPMLLLGSSMDPATPSEWLPDAARLMSHAQTIVVPGGAHGMGGYGCLPSIEARFLAAPLAPVDASCVVPAKTKFALDVADLPG